MKILKILHRVYTDSMDKTLPFYETLLGEKAGNQFHYEERHLDLAQVGSLLILAGSEKALLPIRDTSLTFLVDSIQEFMDYLESQPVKILEPPRKVPTGWNMRVQHPDGLIIEYVEHSPKP